MPTRRRRTLGNLSASKVSLVTEEILVRQFDNGLVLVTEPMPWLESAAFTLLVPAGCARDPDHLLGLGNLVCEMVQRGSGSRSSRQFIEDLEMLGVDSSASVSNAHCSFSGAMPAERLAELRFPSTPTWFADLIWPKTSSKIAGWSVSKRCAPWRTISHRR